MPDANTIWTFREALTRAQIDGRPAIEVLFCAYEAALRKAGFLVMGGQKRWSAGRENHSDDTRPSRDPRPGSTR